MVASSIRNGNCDTLWKIWYAFLVFCGYAFLTYNAVRQYSLFKSQAYDPRYGGLWDETPMNFYIAMLIVALTLLPVFIYSALLKVGNLANDGVVMGRDQDIMKLTLLDNLANSRVKEESTLKAVWLRLKQHLLPYSCYLHVISAFAFLLPLPTLEGEQIRNEVLPKYRIRHTDLDFLFRPDLSHPMTDEDGSIIYQESQALSPEMCNFLIALTLLTVRLPNSFWFAHRPFAFIFSFNLLVTSIHLIFDYCALSLFYKLAKNPVDIVIMSTNQERPQSGHSMQHCQDGFKPFFPPWMAIAFDSVAFLLIICAQMSIYEYGHGHFINNLKKFRQQISGNGSSKDSQASEDLDYPTPYRKENCCYRFWPNIVSLVLMIFVLLVKIPLACQYVVAYWCTNEAVFLVSVVIFAGYLLMWLLMWFSFTVKTSWKFQVDSSVPLKTAEQLNQHNQGLKQEMGINRMNMGTTERQPIYACFHRDNMAMSPSNNSLDAPIRPPGSIDCLSDSSSKSSGPNTSRSMDGAASSNYVYMQHKQMIHPALAQGIPTISEHIDGVPSSEASYDSANSRNAANIALLGYLAAAQQGTLRQTGGGGLDDPYATLASVLSGTAQRRGGGGGGFISPSGMPHNVSSSNDSIMSASVINDNTLNRNNRMRRSSNRVTFKDCHDTIPGSPSLSQEGSNVPSTDSGIGHSLQSPNLPTEACQFLPKLPRSTTYDDYSMFGNLFTQNVNYSDLYNSALTNYMLQTHNSSPPLLPPPLLHGGRPTMNGDYMKVPDILMNEQGIPVSTSNYSNQLQTAGSGGILKSNSMEMGSMNLDNIGTMSKSLTADNQNSVEVSQDQLEQRMCSAV